MNHQDLTTNTNVCTRASIAKPRNPLRLLLGVLSVCMFWSCAGQFPPSGGPEDRDPPSIIATYPENNSTRVHDSRIVLEFDEYVDRASVQNALFISPSVGVMEFDWSGREVEIRFSERLRENTTYVVNVGTDVVDIRNRNRMAESFTLAFTTGNQIDEGMIEGRVFPAKPSDARSGIMVFAYRIDPRGEGNTINRDTLDPRHTKPDHSTQTGKEGNYTLSHLAFGTYRLMAVRDEFKNLLYVPETDEYAMGSADVSIGEQSPKISGVNFRLAKEDTTSPRLIKATSVSDRLFRLEFSEEVDPATVSFGSFTVADTVSGKIVNVLSASPIPPRHVEVMAALGSLSFGATYSVTAQITDMQGLAINPLANTLTFTASAKADTNRVVVSSFSIPDMVRDVSLTPEITIMFSRPVQNVLDSTAITLADSAGNAFTLIPQWLSHMALNVRPARALAGKTWYELKVSASRFADIFDVKGRDSISTLRFSTVDPERFGRLEGVLADESRSDTVGNFYITAREISMRDAEPRPIRIETPGPFIFDSIVEGRYVIEAYRDRNGNKKFDAGHPYPFARSERFVVHQDTIKLRARWPVEGLKLHLR